MRQLNIFYQLKDLIIHYCNANINYTLSFFFHYIFFYFLFFSNNEGYLIHTPGTLFSDCLFYLISIFVQLVLSCIRCKCVSSRRYTKKKRYLQYVLTNVISTCNFNFIALLVCCSPIIGNFSFINTRPHRKNLYQNAA